MKRLNGWQRLWVAVSTAILVLLLVFAALVGPSAKAFGVALAVSVTLALLLYISGRSIRWIVEGFRPPSSSMPTLNATQPRDLGEERKVDGSPTCDSSDPDEWFIQDDNGTRTFPTSDAVREELSRGTDRTHALVHHRSFNGWISASEFRLRFATLAEKQTWTRRGHIALLGAATLAALKGAATGEARNLFYLLGAFAAPYILVACIFLAAWPFRRKRKYPDSRLWWNATLIVLGMSVLSLSTVPATKKVGDPPEVRADKLLRSAPIFTEVAALEPGTYRRIHDTVTASLGRGESPETAVRLARPEVAAVFKRHLARASDEALVAYMTNWATAAKRLRQTNTEQCYDVVFWGRVREVEETREERDERARLMAEVLRSARETPVITFDAERARQLFAESVNDLANRGYRLDLVQSETEAVSLEQQRSLCDAAVKLHESILARPTEEAALAYRHISSP